MLRMATTTTLVRSRTGRPHHWRLALSCGCVVERRVLRSPGAGMREPNRRAECERQPGCRFYRPSVGIGDDSCATEAT